MSLEAPATLASLIRRYRLTAGLSQEDLAERAGLSVRTISDLERGLRRTPHPETTRMVADGLELSGPDRASLIAAARPELDARTYQPSTAQLPASGTLRGSIPSASGTVIGREREISSLISMLSRGTARLITLTGPGGVGKTRLALAVARHAAPVFDGSVTFVALAQVRDPSLVIPAVAHALGVHESGDRPLIDQLCAILANSPTLLVLDNMEQVPEAAPDVATLLSGAPSLSLLVTSRGALHLSEEHQFPVGVLQLPPTGKSEALEAVAASHAVALFIDRAIMVRPNFALTEANAPVVVEICRRLDGLPLAIELAAARVPLLPPAALLARMDRRLPILTGGARDLPARLQTMHAAIAWSHDLLSPAEQTMFRRLAVFMGGFTLEAAEAVIASTDENAASVGASGSPLDGIAALIERGLLWQAEQPDGDARFGMLETIREFGLEQLEISGEEEAVRRSHAHYSLSLAEEFEAGGFALSVGTLDRIERELPNLRLSLDWTEKAEDTVIGLRLAKSLAPLWHLRSHRAEGRGWLERALARDPGSHTVARAAALVQLGNIEFNLGNAELGARHVNEGLELARELGDRRSITSALGLLAVFAVDLGDDQRAGQLLAEVEEWEESLGDRSDILGMVYINRGILERRRGELEQARSSFSNALARSSRVGDIYYRAIAGECLGLVNCDCGEIELAATVFRESLGDWRTVGTREGLIDWLAMVATLAAAVGESDRSCRWFGAVEAQVEIHGFDFPLPERVEFGRTAATVRTGPDDPNWTAGRSFTLDEVTEEAAAWLRVISTLGSQPNLPNDGTHYENEP